jgi:hypothetical protein
MKRSLLGALGAGAVLVGCGTPGQVTGSSVAAPTAAVEVGSLAVGPAASLSSSIGTRPDDAALSIGGAATDTTGGSLPDGQTISPFDVENPLVGLLDPTLRTAIQDAARAGAAEGVDVRLTSGWRSKGFQKRLFDDAVATYGSVAVASQFVASPDASMHVAGRAVDIGPVAADQWMIRNGSRFGLCQIYANEIWHFELAADPQGNCPALRPNAAG